MHILAPRLGELGPFLRPPGLLSLESFFFNSDSSISVSDFINIILQEGSLFISHFLKFGKLDYPKWFNHTRHRAVRLKCWTFHRSQPLCTRQEQVLASYTKNQRTLHPLQTGAFGPITNGRQDISVPCQSRLPKFLPLCFSPYWQYLRWSCWRTIRGTWGFYSPVCLQLYFTQLYNSSIYFYLH